MADRQSIELFYQISDIYDIKYTKLTLYHFLYHILFSFKLILH